MYSFACQYFAINKSGNLYLFIMVYSIVSVIKISNLRKICLKINS